MLMYIMNLKELDIVNCNSNIARDLPTETSSVSLLLSSLQFCMTSAV